LAVAKQADPGGAELEQDLERRGGGGLGFDDEREDGAAGVF